MIGLDQVGGNMILGECKYTRSEKGLSVYHDLQEKAEALEKATKCNTKQYVIFSTAGFTKGLEEEATRNQRLLLVDTFTPREK